MKTFKPTTSQISIANTVFKAMAYEQCVRPIVEGYQRRILADLQSPPALDYGDDSSAPKIVLEPKHSYLLPDDVFKVYHARCQKARDAAGFKVDHPDKCPLLIAEHLVIQAKQALIEEMEPVTGLSLDMLTQAGLDNYHQYIELTLKLLAPFVPHDAKLKIA